ncbi:hypothetical protein TRSC58_04077 [Trypanosoma rangeli SC58]|uniref:Transmembrane protein n=1 Tax=Trypanosoma rangeli SC58 TaxID=429131 RepID=A0A061IZU8_TRYRA|nr:hypothetical protein TRSC58_04077 [Trypanosoma rangeli SC58]
MRALFAATTSANNGTKKTSLVCLLAGSVDLLGLPLFHVCRRRPAAAAAARWQALRQIRRFPSLLSCMSGSPCGCGVRCFGYSPFDSIRKPPKRRSGPHASVFPTAAVSTSSGSSNNSNNVTGSGSQGSGVSRTRPTKPASERLQEAKRIFPETLRSGRYKEDNTRSQRLYEGGASASKSGPDRRFYRKLEDYREVQDDDPYAGVFAESVGVKRRRVKEWQRQFEEEDSNVELPYERTNVIARLAPNWFVRYFLNVRDKGGVEHAGFLWACALITSGLLWVVGYMFYTPPTEASPIAELR